MIAVQERAASAIGKPWSLDASTGNMIHQDSRLIRLSQQLSALDPAQIKSADINDIAVEIVREMTRLRAQSIDGIRAKREGLRWLESTDPIAFDELDTGYLDGALVVSIAKDLLWLEF